MNFQPAFVDFQKMDRVTSIDHFLNQVGEFESGDIVRLLKLAMVVFCAVFIGLQKLLRSCFGEFCETCEFVGGCFRIQFGTYLGNNVFAYKADFSTRGVMFVFTDNKILYLVFFWRMVLNSIVDYKNDVFLAGEQFCQYVVFEQDVGIEHDDPFAIFS